MIKTRTKIITSTKGHLLEEKLNDELDRLEKEGYLIESVSTDLSYAGEPRAFAYMAIGTIVYTEEVLDDINRVGFNIDFGIGESDTINNQQ